MAIPTSPKAETKELIEQGKAQVLILDGLDGSGKGSCAQKTAEILAGSGNNCLLVEFPAYDLPWGQFLTHLLHESDEGLSIYDRMRVYALNRLEVLDSIQEMTQSLSKTSDKPLYIIFDRFVTSNTISAAYYLTSERGGQEYPTGLTDEFLKEMYNFMLDIDHNFLTTLGLGNSKVYIPMLSSDDTIKSMQLDASRAMLDMHENPNVQSLSREAYIKLALIAPEKFEIFSQYSEDGKRMTPDEVSRELLRIANISVLQSDEPGEVIRLQPQPGQINVDRIKEELSTYEQTDLDTFMPKLYQ